jgi:hypothetical protein
MVTVKFCSLVIGSIVIMFSGFNIHGGSILVSKATILLTLPEPSSLPLTGAEAKASGVEMARS